MKTPLRLFATSVVFGLAVSVGRAAPLADMVPEGALLYVAWPGADAYAGTIKDTEFAKLPAEPEVKHFRAMLCEQVWPVLRQKLREETGREGGPPPEAFEPFMSFLSSIWQYPTVFSLVSIAPGQPIPTTDALLLIRAGDQAPAVVAQIDRFAALAAEHDKTLAPRDGEVDGAKWKQIATEAGPSLRYGVRGGDVMFVIGQKILDLVKAGDSARTLSKSAPFDAAMKVVGGSDAVPVFYLDVRGIVKTLDEFAPMLRALQVPVIGEAGGAQKVLEAVGMGTLQSLCAAMTAQEGGIKTTFFIHAPGAGKDGAGTMLRQKALSDDDLRVVPRDASWAGVANFDLRAFYNGILASIEKLSPEVSGQVKGAISNFEKTVGLRIDEDVLAPLGDTWAIFDAPSNGSLLLTGATIVAKARPENKLGDALQALAGFLAGLADAGKNVSVRQESYRGSTIHYVNVAAVPFPVAPAWAQQGEHWILALYPQMVRITLDRLIDKGESILDNTDFQRGRRFMPPGFDSISYADTRAGVQQLYPFALPLVQVLVAMGQGEGMKIDATMMPSLPPILRHVFGQVSASAATDQGYVTVSYSSLPLSGLSGGGVSSMVGIVALETSILLPSLARARELSKRTVSAANLKQIGIAIHVYANDHNDKPPATLKALVESGGITEKVLTSPLGEGEEESYVYVKGELSSPQSILAYEKPEHFNGEGTNVLYGDGHVEFVTMDRFNEQLREVKGAHKTGHDAK